MREMFQSSLTEAAGNLYFFDIENSLSSFFTFSSRVTIWFNLVQVLEAFEYLAMGLRIILEC